MQKAPGSIPSLHKLGKEVQASNPSTQEARTGLLGDTVSRGHMGLGYVGGVRGGMWWIGITKIHCMHL